MRDVPFVDAHVHLWDLNRLSYPWLTPPFDTPGPNGSVEAIAATYLPADYRREAALWNVAGYIHVDAGADSAHAKAETSWLEELEGGPDGIVAFAALDAPDAAEVLAWQVEHAQVRGIRQIVNWHPDRYRTYTPRDLTGDQAWADGFALLEGHGLSFDLQCYPRQMPRLARLFERHPGVPVIVNHLGMPILSDPGGLVEWKAGLAALAALPQVAIKISGVGFARRAWTVEDARPLVLRTIEMFGTDRCLIASDFPTDRLFGSFDDTLGAYAEIISAFSDDEKRALWGGNANRVYRLGLNLEARNAA